MFYCQPRNTSTWIKDFNGFLNVCTHQEAHIRYWIYPMSTTCGPFNVAATYIQPQLRMHDDVIKLKQFPRYWPFVRGIHRSPVNSPHKGQWRGALMFSLVCAWTNGWTNNQNTGDLRRHCVHYDVTAMTTNNRKLHYLHQCLIDANQN